MSVYEKMTALADAIREKTGGTEKLSIDQMTADVAALQIGGSTEEWFNDGNTHLWIHLEEGRTSPMLGIGVNGTVTVDWGDGTTPDVLMGTSVTTRKSTPNHTYSNAGDYVITLTVDGEMGFVGTNNNSQILQNSTSTYESGNTYYPNVLRKVECGEGVSSIGDYAFHACRSLTSVKIPEGVTSIGTQSFRYCYSLTSVKIPDGVTSIGGNAFEQCESLVSVTIPNSVTSIGKNAFQRCQLASVTIPNSVTSIGNNAFDSCYPLASVTIPNSVTAIGENVFRYCQTLASVTIPESVSSIAANAFSYSRGIRYYDFSKHVSVPTLVNSNAFTDSASDCEIRVPAALYDEWIAATNWATYADKIVAV